MVSNTPLADVTRNMEAVAGGALPACSYHMLAQKTIVRIGLVKPIIQIAEWEHTGIQKQYAVIL